MKAAKRRSRYPTFLVLSNFKIILSRPNNEKREIRPREAFIWLVDPDKIYFSPSEMPIWQRRSVKNNSFSFLCETRIKWLKKNSLRVLFSVKFIASNFCVTWSKLTIAIIAQFYLIYFFFQFKKKNQKREKYKK